MAGGIAVDLWSTVYFLKAVDPVAEGAGITLRDMSGQAIGPNLSTSDWCEAAIEGSVVVAGHVYNYAGAAGPESTVCGSREVMRKATLVRWKVSAHPFGEGSRGNALIPFKTVACDMKNPWLPDPAGARPARFGERIFVPAARGVVLPDGSLHDGIFTCGDVGGAINGNHVDIFVGAVNGGDREALQINPFSFVGNRPDKTYPAFVLN